MNDRARVPFALVGVLLLVGSATLSASLVGHDPVTEPRTEAAMEDARATTLSALRSATRAAARRAAREPVVAPANTTVGRAVNGSDTFRAYLRLRVYRAFRDTLDGVRGDAGVRVEARLPGVGNASTLQRALDRVSVAGADANGTAVRVTVANVTLVAVRDGRVVERVHVSPTVTVATPVLLLHDRTARFDRRLDRPATAPGLARGVTARLYPLAWGRGYAQYGGAPVANVLANRHLEVAVNHALLAQQRAAFGRTDPAARRGVTTLAARTLGTDLLTASGYSAKQAAYLREQVDAATPNSTLSPIESFNRESQPGPEEPMSVGVNRTATRAFRGFVDGRLARVLDRTYSAEVRLVAATDRVASSRSREGSPGPEWTLVATDRTTRTSTARRDLAPTSPPNGTHTLASFDRRVTARTVIRRTWRRENRTTVTRSVRRRVTDVAVSVVGRHAPSDRVPAAPIRGVHQRGAGPLDGPNLGGIEARAVARLVGERGGPDAVAKRAAAGSLSTDAVRADGARPDDLRAWVYADLRAFRRRLATVSVKVERGAVGTYAANPAADLASELRSRRRALVGTPGEYDGVATKARYAARAAYFESVLARLDRRASDRKSVGSRVSDRLRSLGTSLSHVRGAMANRSLAVAPSRRAPSGVAGSVELSVDGAPPVVTLAALDRRRLDVGGTGSYRPLVARNLNVFTAPHGDIADSVVGSLFRSRRSRLRVAAETLRASRRLPDDAVTEKLRARRSELARRLDAAVASRRERLRRTLTEAGVGADRAARRTLVGDALDHWSTLPGRALALANGSAADRVADLAATRYPDALVGVEARDRLRLSLDAASRRGEGIPQRPVNETASAVRAVGRTVVGEMAKQAAGSAVNATAERARQAFRRRTGRSLARVPAGLPVTPVPAYWYATTNLWLVEARGAYARFTARVPRGTPGRGLRYVRDGRAVRYDWDGDGTRERVGTASRVDLQVHTAVVVVVPPGGRGVGDTDGNADERSAGWNAART
ncbi:DUF7286 family protein [Halorarius halobius]|uniref:DUF7286 family protein n=1 Tax=Halorarius halobius TaxID=2962671 RepID=UPI0020CC53DB|nr:hypothetical protein [Halorarius halobius]